VLVGTSQTVAKGFVRPSSAPLLSAIRPEAVLRRAFAMCLAKSRDDIEFTADQIKSIRQDLTVQQLESAFSAAVYEFHTRVAVLAGHLAEIGQCLTHVRSLHAKGILGPPRAEFEAVCTNAYLLPPAACPDVSVEFAGYRILYSGLMGKHDDDVANEIARLEATHNAQVWQHPFISHAINAVTNKHNAVVFRKMVSAAPTPLYGRLMSLFLPKLRLEWIRTLVSGFVDFVSEEALVEYLGLESGEEAQGLLEPVVGASMWKKGIHCRDCRARLTNFVDELTHQRT
jgi:hypothetical protein